MAPSYPWQRSNPSASPNANTNANNGSSSTTTTTTAPDTRPIVVSATTTSRAPLSPAGLTFPSPSALRIRNSPRNPSTTGTGSGAGENGNSTPGAFSSERNSYPSPAGSSSSTPGAANGNGKGKGKGRSFFGRRRKDSDASLATPGGSGTTPLNGNKGKGKGWVQVPDDSPGSVGSPGTGTPGSAVPLRRFDARGYPLTTARDEGTPSKAGSGNRNGNGTGSGAGAGYGYSPESSKLRPLASAAAGAGTGSSQAYANANANASANGRGRSSSMHSETSSTGAAVDERVTSGAPGDWRDEMARSRVGRQGENSRGNINTSRASYFEDVLTAANNRGSLHRPGAGGAGAANPSPPSAASSAVPTPATLYPPGSGAMMDYSLSAPSYSPADGPSRGPAHDYGFFPNNSYESMAYPDHKGNGYGAGGGLGMGGGGKGGPSPLPSLYAQSVASHATHFSTRSGESMTHFRKYDKMQDSYGAFSISSKGGQKHLGQMFSLPPDPSTWTYLGPEADDEFHDPDARPREQTRFVAALFTLRGAGNVGCLALLVVVLVGMFAVYPILSQVLERVQPSYGAYNLGGINATGQTPDFGPFQLIDHDTPASAYKHTSLETGETWDLVFSDEFNNPGRTFWDGDDPYWQAADLHYWVTNNKEWYDPRYATTVDGALRMSFSNEPQKGLNYTGSMITTWNRFCFTGGYLETSVSLPATSKVYGLWPAVWTLGNLARAGYGGTTDGMWPYTYDSCDLGTLANQTLNGQPVPAPGTGDSYNQDHLSYLPGQRLSRCTCGNDLTHPGPKHADGSWVGRGAPEIDVFEAVVDHTTMMGEVSQSAQWAPFDPSYGFDNSSSANFRIYNDTMTKLNPWSGSVWQQSTTALSYTDQRCYTGDTGCYSIYGFEYAPGDDGYVTWVNDGRLAWTVRASAMGPNAISMVNTRPIPEEAMYLIINLGMSENFGAIDYDGLEPLFPVHMDVDYVRVYQDPKKRNIGCSPPDFPTAEYIARYADVYNNPNITVMSQIPDFVKPKNRLIDTC